jgi:alginate O-acetyltransferase complex protein AlgJ
VIVRAILVLVVIFSGFAAVLAGGHETILEVVGSTTRTDLIEGHFAQKIDKTIFRAVSRSTALDGLVAGVQYRLLGDAGPQVRAGCGDWLYSIEELRAERDDRQNMLARAELLSQLVRAVKARGAIPVIVPVPDKAEQVEDQLCGLTAHQSRLRDQFWSEMAGLDGAIVIDVRKNWPRPGYWRTDTHWDQSGARFAADKVAQAINTAIGPGEDHVRLVEGTIREHAGDLSRLAGLTDAPAYLAPAPEQEKEIKAEIEHSGGLLDDTPVTTVILAGSSFSLNSGFFDFLEMSLSREVAQVSQPGGGFAGALLETLQKRASSLAKARAVVWEWPMRSLVAPLSESERSFMNQARSLRETTTR